MATTGILLEACVDSVESAVAAEAGGAGRVELCAALVDGGVTPSAGMIARCRERVRLPIYVMIRPRGGDFLYTDAEFAVMRRDIDAAKSEGADGVVLGLLLPDGMIDAGRTRRLVDRARPMDVTFHRAIDVSRDPYEALETLIAIGVDRVLTSGQAPSALSGARVIAKMVRQAAERVVILPGGRITEQNARQLIQRTGASEIHVRGARRVRSGMQHRSTRVTFRGEPLPNDFVLELTDASRIRKIAAAVGNLRSPPPRKRR
jgi:copper homeostasis protein